jgi:hypothetical protein
VAGELHTRISVQDKKVQRGDADDSTHQYKRHMKVDERERLGTAPLRR